MMGVEVRRYCVNGAEVDLVTTATLFRVIPISNVFLKKMLARKVIPSSMFVTPAVKYKLFRNLLTMEHMELLITWFSDITCNFTKNIRPNNIQVQELHKEWAKINDMYCKKLGLPLEFGLETIAKDREKYVTKMAVALETLKLRLAKKNGGNLTEFRNQVKSMCVSSKHVFTEKDIQSIDKTMDFIESEAELENTKKTWGKTKIARDKGKEKK